MVKPLAVIKWLALLSLPAAICACGCVLAGTTTSGTASRVYGSAIDACDAISVLFRRLLDGSTLSGNVSVASSGAAARYRVLLQEGGCRLDITPDDSWERGAELRVYSKGGEGGIRFADSRTFATFTLVYYVEYP